MIPIKNYWHYGTIYYIMLYKMIPTFESVDEILKCDDSSSTVLVVLFTLVFKSVYTI